MPLKSAGLIHIPDAAGTQFDHGAFEPKSRRVFVAHTARDRIEVIDTGTSRHMAALPGFPEAAGVVADDGQVLVTSRGAAELAWIDARNLETLGVLGTGPRPNGVAFVARLRLALVACIGDESSGPKLQSLKLGENQRWSIDLPGRPRWCVANPGGTHVFLAIREPSMVLAARLPHLGGVKQWMLPSAGAHGMDMDHSTGTLYVACDGGALVEVDTVAGTTRREWPLSGVPDATFFNPASGLVHVAIDKPGLVQSIDPHTGGCSEFATAPGAKTAALVPPDRLYVFSPSGEALVLTAA